MPAKQIKCPKCGRQTAVLGNRNVDGHLQGPFGSSPGKRCPQGGQRLSQ